MQKFSYYCDIASLKVGKNGTYFYIPNGLGDGSYKLFIGKANSDKTPIGAIFCGVIEGDIDIYDYDCSGGEILTTISGRYVIYNDYGNIYLLKLGE